MLHLQKIFENNFLKKIIFYIPFVLILIYAILIRLDIPNLVIELQDDYQCALIAIDTKTSFSSCLLLSYYHLVVILFTKIFNSFSGVLIFHHFLSLLNYSLLLVVAHLLFVKILKKYNFLTKIFLYIFYICFVFIFIQIPEFVVFQYSMRPEYLTIFFLIFFVFTYIYIFASNRKKLSVVYIFFIVNIISVFLQPKLIFLFIFNSIIYLYLLKINNLLSKKVFLNFLYTFLFLFLLNQYIISNIILSKELYFSNIFWRHQQIINPYIQEDLKSSNFSKFNTSILNDINDVYQKNISKYNDDSISNPKVLDPIIYVDGANALFKYNLREINAVMNHYYLKSQILSPHKYLNNYFKEWSKLIKSKYIFFNFIYSDINQSTYLETYSWLEKRYSNKVNPEYLNKYISNVEEQSKNEYELKTIYLFKDLKNILNKIFIPLILIHIFFLVLIKNKNNTLKIFQKITNILILSFICMYSITTYLFIYTDRYIAETYPLTLFIVFFIISSIFLSLIEIFKIIKNKYFIKFNQIKIKKIFFYIPFIFLFLYSLCVRCKIPSLVIEIFDEYQFLLLSIDSGNGFDSGMTMPYYQIIILIFTKIFNSFSAIIFFQHFIFFIYFLILVLIAKLVFKKILANQSFYLKFILYILYLISILILTQTPMIISFEYSMRPEIFSIFFQIFLVFIYINLVFVKKINKKYINLYLIITILSFLFQIKFIFVFLINIIYILYLLNIKKIFDIKIISSFLKIIIFFLMFHVIVSTIIFRTDYHKSLYISNVFWKNYSYIGKYINQDITSKKFNKFDKIFLINIDSVYQKNKDTYNKGITNVTQIDPITYKDGLNLLLNDADKYNKIFHYYYLKSLVFSPHLYIRNYLNELSLVINKSNYIFYNNSLIIDQNIYIEKKYWTENWYKNRNKPQYLLRYIEQISKQSEKELQIYSLNFYSNNYIFINNFYKYTIFAYLLVYIFFNKTKNLLVSQFRHITNILILSSISLYSFTAFFFVYSERYITEVYPFIIFSFFFAISTIIITILKSLNEK